MPAMDAIWSYNPAVSMGSAGTRIERSNAACWSNLGGTGFGVDRSTHEDIRSAEDIARAVIDDVGGDCHGTFQDWSRKLQRSASRSTRLDGGEGNGCIGAQSIPIQSIVRPVGFVCCAVGTSASTKERESHCSRSKAGTSSRWL